MNGNEDKRRFSVVMFWLASVMKDIGGKPKLMKLPADKKTGTPEINVQRDYYEALQDIRIERIEWAAKHIFKNEIWFPMPSELRKAAMLAPTTVFPALEREQVLLPEITEQQINDAKQKLDDLLNSLGDLGQF